MVGGCSGGSDPRSSSRAPASRPPTSPLRSAGFLAAGREVRLRSVGSVRSNSDSSRFVRPTRQVAGLAARDKIRRVIAAAPTPWDDVIDLACPPAAVAAAAPATLQDGRAHATPCRRAASAQTHPRGRSLTKDLLHREGPVTLVVGLARPNHRRERTLPVS